MNHCESKILEVHKKERNKSFKTKHERKREQYLADA